MVRTEWGRGGHPVAGAPSSLWEHRKFRRIGRPAGKRGRVTPALSFPSPEERVKKPSQGHTSDKTPRSENCARGIYATEPSYKPQEQSGSERKATCDRVKPHARHQPHKDTRVKAAIQRDQHTRQVFGPQVRKAGDAGVGSGGQATQMYRAPGDSKKAGWRREAWRRALSTVAGIPGTKDRGTEGPVGAEAGMGGVAGADGPAR